MALANMCNIILYVCAFLLLATWLLTQHINKEKLNKIEFQYQFLLLVAFKNLKSSCAQQCIF
jgi:hypothetical protein